MLHPLCWEAKLTTTGWSKTASVAHYPVTKELGQTCFWTVSDPLWLPHESKRNLEEVIYFQQKNQSRTTSPNLLVDWITWRSVMVSGNHGNVDILNPTAACSGSVTEWNKRRSSWLPTNQSQKPVTISVNNNTNNYIALSHNNSHNDSNTIATTTYITTPTTMLPSPKITYWDLAEAPEVYLPLFHPQNSPVPRSLDDPVFLLWLTEGRTLGRSLLP